VKTQGRTETPETVFQQNPVVLHEAGTTPDSVAHQAIAEGREFWVTGICLAKCQYIAANTKAEAIVGLLEDPQTPGLICDVILGDQTCSGALCEHDSDLVSLAIAREAERQDPPRRLVSMTHSHYLSSSYTSALDKQNQISLLAQFCGWQANRQRLVRGEVETEKERSGNGVRVEFDDLDGLSVLIEGIAEESFLADKRITLEIREEVSSSSFSTFNARGECVVPMVSRTQQCALCGQEEITERAYQDVVIHVVQNGKPSGDELEFLDREIESKVKYGYLPTPTYTPPHALYKNGDSGDYQQIPIAYLPPNTCEERSPLTSPSYVVSCGGAYVGTISGAVLEEAASVFPALREALNWD